MAQEYNSNLEKLHENLQKRNSGFTRTLDEFAEDMKDVSKRARLHQSLRADIPNFRTFKEFSEDLGFSDNNISETVSLSTQQQSNPDFVNPLTQRQQQSNPDFVNPLTQRQQQSNPDFVNPLTQRQQQPTIFDKITERSLEQADNAVQRRRMQLALKDYVNNTLYQLGFDNIFTNVRAKLKRDAISTYKNSANQNPFSTSANALNIARQANEIDNPGRAIEETLKQLDAEYQKKIGKTSDDVKEQDIKKAGISDEQYNAMLSEAVRRMEKYYTDTNTPKSSIEYIARKALNSSILGMLSQTATQDLSQRRFTEQGMQNYNANGWEDFAGSAVGMVVLDAPLFLGAGAVANAGVKGATNLIGRNVINRLVAQGTERAVAEQTLARYASQGALKYATGAATGALNFAQVSGLGSIAGQMYQGDDVNIGTVLADTAEGAVTGAVLGAFSPLVAQYFKPQIQSVIGDKAGALGALATDFAGKTGLFAVSSALGKSLATPDYTDNGDGTYTVDLGFGQSQVLNKQQLDRYIEDSRRIDWSEEIKHAALTNLAFGFSHAIKSGANIYQGAVNIASENGSKPYKFADVAKNIRTIVNNKLKSAPDNYKLSKEELDMLFKGESEGKTAIDYIESLYSEGGGDAVKALQTKLSGMLSDADIPLSTKSKVNYLLTGSPLNIGDPVSATLTEIKDGYVVETRDITNNLIDRFTFKSEEQAQAMLTRAESQIRDSQRRLLETKIQTMRDFETIKQSIQDICNKYSLNPKDLTAIYEDARRGQYTPTEIEAQAISEIDNILSNNKLTLQNREAWLNIAKQSVAREFGITITDLNDILTSKYESLSDRNRLVFDRYIASLVSIERDNSQPTDQTSKIKLIGAEATAIKNIARENVNTTSGRVQTVKVNGSDKASYIKSGNLITTTDADGNIIIDREKSDKIVVVVTDGKPQQASIESISEVISDESLQEIDAQIDEEANATIKAQQTFPAGSIVYNPDVPTQFSAVMNSNAEGVTIPVIDNNGEVVDVIKPLDEALNEFKVLPIKEGVRFGEYEVKSLNEDGTITIAYNNSNEETISANDLANILQEVGFNANDLNEEQNSVQMPGTTTDETQLTVEPETQQPTAETLFNKFVSENGGNEQLVTNRIKATVKDIDSRLYKAEQDLKKAEGDLANTPFDTDAEKKVYKKIATINKEIAELNAKKESFSVYKSVIDAKEKAEQDALREKNALANANREAKELAESEEKRRVAELNGEVLAHEVGNNIKLRWKNAPKVYGAEDIITLQNGKTYKGRYVLHSAFDATPSHNYETFESSVGFPHNEKGQNINDRDYTREDNRQITIAQANGYNGNALDNTPVITKDGVVISGNGRTIAGQIAAKNGTDKAYNEALQIKLAGKGFKQEDLKGINAPRISFEVEGDVPYTTETFAEFNKTAQKTDNETEKTISLSKQIDKKGIKKLTDIFNRYTTIDSMFASPVAYSELTRIMQELGLINSMDLASMTKKTTDGKYVLSDTGEKKVSQMILGTILDEEAIRALDANKSMRRALLQSFSTISNNISRLGELSIKGSLNGALSIIREAKTSDMPLQLYFRQTNLFDAPVQERYTPTECMLAILLDNAGANTIREVVEKHTKAVESESLAGGNLFGEIKSEEEVSKRIFDNFASTEEGKQLLEKYGYYRQQQEESVNGDTRIADSGSTGENTQRTIDRTPKESGEIKTDGSVGSGETSADNTVGTQQQRTDGEQTSLDNTSGKSGNGEALPKVSEQVSDEQRGTIPTSQDEGAVSNLATNPVALQVAQSAQREQVKRQVLAWDDEFRKAQTQEEKENVLSNILDALEARDTFLYNVGNVLDVAQQAGIDGRNLQNLALKIAELDKDASMGGFMLPNGSILIDTDTSVASFLGTYAHEYQHRLNRTNRDTANNIADLFYKYSIDPKNVISQLSGSYEYDYIDNEYELADEVSAFISQMLVENAYNKKATAEQLYPIINDRKVTDLIVEDLYENGSALKLQTQISKYYGTRNESSKPETRRSRGTSISERGGNTSNEQTPSGKSSQIQGQGLGLDERHGGLHQSTEEINGTESVVDKVNNFLKSQPKEKIEDYGEKIGGARKDIARTMADRINLKGDTVRKIFPKFDYKKLIERGLDRELATGVKTIEGLIDAEFKTQKRHYGKARALNAVRFFANYAKNYLEGKTDDSFTENGWRLSEYGKKYVALNLELVSELNKVIGDNVFDLDLSDYHIIPIASNDNIRYYRDGKELKNPAYKAMAGMYKVKGFTVDEKADAFKFVVDELKKNISYKEANPFELKLYYTLYEKNSEYVAIKYKGKILPITEKGIKGGFSYIEEHRAELQAKAQQIVDEYEQNKKDNKGASETESEKPKLQLGDYRERKGEDYRKGKDISAKDLSDTFGFRGVEFGNYVTQAERQNFLNETYDALLDMAGIIGVSPKALSLGGKLGFAIGARGGGNNSAHYEPAKNVINITKTRGAGALAHEWWHALDNFFGDNTFNYKYATERLLKRGARDEMKKAFESLINSLEYSDYYKRSKRLDDTTHKKYYALPTELGARAFENYIQRKLIEKGQVNDFLSSFTPTDRWNLELNKYPYPVESEIGNFDEKFENLFSTMLEREEDGMPILYQVSTPRNTSLDEVMLQIKNKRLDTDFEKAYKSNDTAKARELVLQSAKLNMPQTKVVDKNGNPLVVYHGTNKVEVKKVWNSEHKWYENTYKEFTKFKRSVDGLKNSGHFFVSDEDNAGGYGNKIYSVYLNLKNPLIIDCKGSVYSGVKFNGEIKDTYEWAEYAEFSGYDGVVFKNIRDGVDLSYMDKINDEYVAFHSSQIKSAEPFTFDDNGELIPLSKRFSGSDDIRYQITNKEDKDYLSAVNSGDMETARKMVYEAAKKAGFNESSDYQGTSAFNGKAPSSNAYYNSLEERLDTWNNTDYFDGDWSLADELVHGIKMGGLEEWRLNDRAYKFAKQAGKESISNIRRVKTKVDNGEKDITIKMYRSVPADIKEDSFRNGDWITPSKTYAIENAEVHGWGNNYRIIEQEVPIENVWWDGNDINEWGYDDGKEYVYKNTKNNKKLLATVTYDDNGNIIPLSKRFNDNENDIRYQIVSAVNEHFNEELQKQIDGTLPKGHIYQLGKPSSILLSAGFPNDPIELSANRLSDKSKQQNHIFEIADIKNLPKALQQPLALFAYGDKTKAQNAIVEITHNGKNFVVGIHFNHNRNGLEVSSIRGLYPKDNAEWLNWITQGKATYIDKEKIQTLIDQQRTNLADVEYLDLNSLAKKIQDFDTTKFFEENLQEKENVSFQISNKDKFINGLNTPDEIFDALSEAPSISGNLATTNRIISELEQRYNGELIGASNGAKTAISNGLLPYIANRRGAEYHHLRFRDADGNTFVEKVEFDTPENIENLTNISFQIDNKENKKPKYQPQTINETLKSAVIANAEKVDKYGRNGRKLIIGEIDKIGNALTQQNKQIKESVKDLTDFIRAVVGVAKLDEVTATELSRLLSVINNNATKTDLQNAFEKVADIVLDRQIKNAEKALYNLTTTQTSKLAQNGVEIGKTVGEETRQILQGFWECRSLPDDAIKERRANINERLESITDKERIKELNDYLTGLDLAEEYRQLVISTKESIRNLKEEIKDDTIKLIGLTGTEKEIAKELLHASQSTLRLLKGDVIRDIDMFSALFSSVIEKGKSDFQIFADEKKAHKDDILHRAFSDLKGVVPKADEREESRFKRSVRNVTDWLKSPVYTFDHLLKEIGRNSIEGKGELSRYFSEKITKASQDEWNGRQELRKTLDEKAQELFGMDYGKVIAKLSNNYLDADFDWIDADGKKNSKKLTVGNAMYLYMVNKMADGKMKLRKMNIEEEDVENIKSMLPENIVKLADWLQDTFLRETGDKYSSTYKKVFGIAMPRVENYVPLRIQKSAVESKEEVGTEEADRIPSKVTGSIIKRTVNSKRVDIVNTNAMELILDHIDEMEHWNAYVSTIEDVNTLLANKLFRNKLETLHKGLFKVFKDTATIALEQYRPKTSTADRGVNTAIKLVGASKIAFRLSPAIKQLLSLPAFAVEGNSAFYGYLIKSMATPANSIKWCYANLPLFRKRWDMRIAGDEKLQFGNDENAIAKWINSHILKYGMIANSAVDVLTCAVGTKAVYDNKLNEYTQRGMSKEEAERRAKLDAEISYNLTQQSAEGLYESVMQKDRTFISSALSLFQNSSFAFGRQFIEAIQGLKAHFNSDLRQKLIDNAKKNLKELYPNEDDQNIENWAKQDVNRAKRKNIARLVMFGYLIQLFWNIGGNWFDLIFGDDNEEKKKTIATQAIKSLTQPIRGFAGGNYLESGISAFIERNQIAMGDNLHPVFSDISKFIRQMQKSYKDNDELLACEAMLEVFGNMQGVNPQTFEYIYSKIGDLVDRKEMTWLDVKQDFALLASVPPSQQKRMVLAKRDGETYDEYVARYANYRRLKNYGVFSLLKKNEPLTEKELKEAKKTASKTEYFNSDTDYKLKPITEEVTEYSEEVKKLKNTNEAEYKKEINSPRYKAYKKLEDRIKKVEKMKKPNIFHFKAIDNYYKDFKKYND